MSTSKKKSLATIARMRRGSIQSTVSQSNSIISNVIEVKPAPNIRTKDYFETKSDIIPSFSPKPTENLYKTRSETCIHPIANSCFYDEIEESSKKKYDSSPLENSQHRSVENKINDIPTYCNSTWCESKASVQNDKLKSDEREKSYENFLNKLQLSNSGFDKKSRVNSSNKLQKSSHGLDYNSSIENGFAYSMDSTLQLSSSSQENQSSVSSSALSNISFLPSISTSDVRKRSYLSGCVSGHKSLLGIDELSRYFPERKVRIFVGTWNMNGRSAENLNDFLLPKNISYLPDIFVIGTQESVIDRKEWEIEVQTTIGPSHVLFHSAVIGVLFLTIFMRRDLVWFCSIPEQSTVTTRHVSAIKTKGAVGICFIFFGTSFLFITSHLSAHDHNLKARELEYVKIRQGLDLPKILSTKNQYMNKDVTSRFDCVFWLGDLNYRITTERSTALKILRNSNQESFKRLLHGDQLLNEMKMGSLFHGFQEEVIKFPPTYKYDLNSDHYDSSQKLRTPSYTDRILYRSRKKCKVSCLLYDSAPSIKSSDHKPVYGLFDVGIRPGTDNIPLAAGMFDREVYIEAIKKRSLHLEPIKSSTSVVCSLM